MNSFYSAEELSALGFRSVGKDVNISKNACFYGTDCISIGDHVRIDDFCILSGNIQIGSYVHIAPFCALFGKYGITIEDFCGLSSRVSIYSATDDYSGDYLTNPTVPDHYKNVVGGLVNLKKHVIIAASSVILPNVTIGEGAAVGTLSLVAKNLEPWKIYMGVPCRIINDRSKEVLRWEQQLLWELK